MLVWFGLISLTSNSTMKIAHPREWPLPQLGLEDKKTHELGWTQLTHNPHEQEISICCHEPLR